MCCCSRRNNMTLSLPQYGDQRCRCRRPSDHRSASSLAQYSIACRNAFRVPADIEQCGETDLVQWFFLVSLCVLVLWHHNHFGEQFFDALCYVCELPAKCEWCTHFQWRFNWVIFRSLLFGRFLPWIFRHPIWWMCIGQQYSRQHRRLPRITILKSEY